MQLEAMRELPSIADLTGPRSYPRASTADLGPYVLHERLGVGGMATVYRARRRDDPTAHDVALKRLHPHLLDDPRSVAAFVKEARIAVLLDHPAIRRVLSLSRQSSELYLVMEYVDGTSLLQLLRNASKANHLPCLAGALTILTRLCDVMHYAHELVDEHGASARFVHRDISPSNLILTTSGRLKIIDMGVASAEVGDLVTRSGHIKGKYGYMAPEVMSGGRFDRRADIYSIGVVAWELLTAHKLFAVRGALSDVTRVRERPVRPPSAFNPACPPDLDAIVLRALSADPAARWPTAAFLRDALGSIAARLDRSISDDAVLAWIHGLQATVDPAPRPRLDFVRLSRGTNEQAAVGASTAAATGPGQRRGRSHRRTLAIGILAGAVTAALLALILGSACPSGNNAAAGPNRSDRATARGPADGPAATPSPPHRARRAGMAAAPAAATARPDAGVRLIDAAELTRISGPHPRSRSTQAPYRARLCIDREGKVTSAELLEGPERLTTRITRSLLRWRYQPHSRRGQPRPACFDIASHVRKLHRRAR